MSGTEQDFILEATEDLAYHIRCPLKLLFTCLPDIEQVTDIYFGCKLCDNAVALYQGEETFVEHIRTAHPDHYSTDQRPPIAVKTENARLPLEIFDLDQTDGNRDDLSLNTMAQEADKKFRSESGEELHFVIEDTNMRTDGMEYKADVADEQIADEQIADEQIADKEHTEAVDHELRAIKTEHEQYEQDDDASLILDDGDDVGQADDDNDGSIDAAPIKRTFDPRVLAVLRRAKTEPAQTPTTKTATPAPPKRSQPVTKVRTEIVNQDGSTIVVMREMNPEDADYDEHIDDAAAAADAANTSIVMTDEPQEDLVLSKDGTRWVRRRGRKRLTDFEKLTRFACAECGKVCHFRKQLEEHQLSVHQGVKPYACEECGNRFSKVANLQTHMRIHTGERPFMCEQCPKKFVAKSQLVAHMRAHSTERPFPCEYCEKAFKDKSSLKMHIMTHTGEKPHVCEQCGKAFRFKIDLTIHIADHEGRNPLTCQVCGKSFSKRHNFTKHMYVHTGEKKYQCQLCSARFREKSHLNRHIRLHSGVRPYHCDMGCNKAFPDLGSLNRHRRTHTTAYKCSVCEKTFTQKHHAERHLTIHMGPPYK